MKKYVKVIIEDENGKSLVHHYISKDTWDVPAGQIEDGEIPQVAAARELLERTGFVIDTSNLKASGEDGDFYIFKGERKDLTKVAEPGEKGGYSTSIRWS